MDGADAKNRSRAESRVFYRLEPGMEAGWGREWWRRADAKYRGRPRAGIVVGWSQE